jgi:hypothetical protein
MRKLLTAAAIMVFFVLLFAGAAHAQYSGQFYRSGNDYIKICDSDGAYQRELSQESRTYTQGVCQGWTLGVLDGISTIPNANVCPPENSIVSQYVLVVIAYMKTHPEQLTRRASYLAVAAFKTAWACKDAAGQR